MSTIDTTGWNEYPFEAFGRTYVSKVSPNSPLMSRIKNLPNGVFESMNRNAVSELVGEDMSRADILNKLDMINEGGTHAILELVG